MSLALVDHTPGAFKFYVKNDFKKGNKRKKTKRLNVFYVCVQFLDSYFCLKKNGSSDMHVLCKTIITPCVRDFDLLKEKKLW